MTKNYSIQNAACMPVARMRDSVVTTTKTRNALHRFVIRIERSTRKSMMLILLFLLPLILHAQEQKEVFVLEVTTTVDGEIFAIPLSGRLNNNWGKPYHWDINWGDGEPDQTYSSITSGAPLNSGNSEGIRHEYSNARTYTITIKPTQVDGQTNDAWLGAFGFSKNFYSGANATANRNRVTKINSPLTPLMTRTQAQVDEGTAPDYEWYDTFSGCKNLIMGDDFCFSDDWNSITTVGDFFAAGMFDGCSNAAFTMNDKFNLPQAITTVGEAFASNMFINCSGNAFTMNEEFNLPQAITTVGDGFASNMFNNCSGDAFTMNDVFNLPHALTTVDESFASNIFSGCSGKSFTMNDEFNLPQAITTVKNNFASGMFLNCSGDAFMMNSIFNLPQGIKNANGSFASYMFYNCSGNAFRMNDVFNLPQEITDAGGYFTCHMFYGCSGNAFTMNDVFNFPQGITTVGEYFASNMFDSCKGNAFTMNDVFNLPQGITTVDEFFVSDLFKECSGNAFTMNDVFNLPQKITTVGDFFAVGMFYHCSGDAFTMNDVFNLPQGITTAGDVFAAAMFLNCSGSGFMVNDVFVFPTFDEIPSGAFSLTFHSLGNSTVQTRTASSIVGGNDFFVNYLSSNFEPNSFQNSGCFLDLDYIPNMLGGKGEAGIIVSIGTQKGVLTEGTTGTVTFKVSTANMDDGDYKPDLIDAPVGVILGNEGLVTINNNNGMLILNTAAAPSAGTYKLALEFEGLSPIPVDLNVSAFILVTGITVKGSGDATTITTAGGALQMIAEVLPDDATNPTVA